MTIENAGNATIGSNLTTPVAAAMMTGPVPGLGNSAHQLSVTFMGSSDRNKFESSFSGKGGATGFNSTNDYGG